jgi:hypothetical protein
MPRALLSAVLSLSILFSTVVAAQDALQEYQMRNLRPQGGELTRR